MPERSTQIEKLHAVGRYALGVDWADRHESIIPFRSIRRACPCVTCSAASPDRALSREAEQLVDVQVLGGQSVFVRWGDAHETILLVDELRDLCRCARCVGEPDYPISGR